MVAMPTAPCRTVRLQAVVFVFLTAGLCLPLPHPYARPTLLDTSLTSVETDIIIVYGKSYYINPTSSFLLNSHSTHSRESQSQTHTSSASESQTMTTYGTIPSSSTSTPTVEFITSAKDGIKSGLGTRRPWNLLLNFRALALPSNFSDAVSRVRHNLSYFRMNYAIVVLVILFLSLLWHPISLMVLLAMMALWLFLYFLRDKPLVVFGRTIDDRVVMIVLSVLTIVFLLLTKATWNIVGAVLIGAAVLLLHAVLRKTDDLFLDEEEVTAFGSH